LEKYLKVSIKVNRKKMILISKLRTLIRVVLKILYEKIYINIIFKSLLSSKNYEKKEIIDKFHRFYYYSHKFGGTWKNTQWLGVSIYKNPLDLWIYQEIIYTLKPDIIIECGTKYGGSALYFATLCDIVNNGEIITIDIEAQKNRPQHKRIQYLLGDATSKEIIGQLEKLTSGNKKVMVVLDDLHIKDHVLEELRIYSKFVSKESYLIVEDTHLNNHPIDPFFGPGPMEAIKEFLKVNNNFKVDKSKEKFYMTWNRNGFLKKIK